MWLNPHGFLKAARLPGANPKAVVALGARRNGTRRPRSRCRRRCTVVSITVNGKYRVDATINKENMLQRIHTWVPDPVLGDMNYEHEFTNASYVDLGNGIRFPTGWHSHQGWDDNYRRQSVSAGHNAFGGTLQGHQGRTPVPGPVTVPEPVRQADLPGPRRDAASWPTASTCSAAARTTASPSSSRTSSRSSRRRSTRQRSLAVIEEIVKLMPGQADPLRSSTRTSTSTTPAGCAPTCTSARPSSRT